MQTLHDLQQAFFRAVYDNDFTLAEVIQSDSNLDGQARLKVYQSSVLGIQTDALAAVYPVIQKLVGEDFFLAMGKAYLRDYFSPSGDLHNLGSQMDEFLQDFKPVEQLPYLTDIARFEWAWHRLFHAADETVMDLTRLAEVPAEDHASLVFYLRDGACLLSSPYPVHRIWQVNQDDWDEELGVDLDEGGVTLLITREGYDVVVHSLNANEWDFLQLLQSGKNISEIASEKPELPLGELLPQCVAKGWITRFEINVPPINS